jgi:hypothetical protein
VAGVLDTLIRSTEALVDVADALAPEHPFESTLDDVIAACGEEGLLSFLSRAGDLARVVDGVVARVAGEVERRSGAEHDEPLARRMGETSAAALVAARAGVEQRRAADWCKVGTAVQARTTFLGERLTADRAAIGAALDAGVVSLAAARLIISTLDEIEQLRPRDEVDETERMLVQLASQLTVADLGTVCRRTRDHVDPDGSEPREELLRAQSGIRWVKRRDGSPRAVIDLDPESEGWLRAALDARTARKRQPLFTDELETPSDLDVRPWPQVELDALVSIARDSLKADEGDVSGTPVTMLVISGYEELRTGIGSAQIAGVEQAISARTARRLACDANIIPVVLGGESQPLDIGAGRRLFSKAQRHAMAVRDGGCIWPGCSAPPGRCEAAHIVPWSLDPMTDLSNGVLLCRFHHRRYDLDGWGFEWRGSTPYFIPPPWVDACRTPRRGGQVVAAV